MSNLRQFGQAATLFWDDYDGYFWFRTNWSSMGTLTSGLQDRRPGGLLPPYLGYTLDSWEHSRQAKEVDPTVFTCPSQIMQYPTARAWSWTYTFNWYLSLAQGDDDGHPIPSAGPDRVMEVTRTSSTAMFMDGRAVRDDGPPSFWLYKEAMYEGWLQTDITNGHGMYPHDKSSNVVFVDGHVERISRDDFIQKTDPETYFWGAIYVD